MSALRELDRTILLCRDYVSDGLSNSEVCRALQEVNVLCISDLKNVSSHSGQTALITLVSLLNRMGMQVGLSIPEATILLPQPPICGTGLKEALMASSESLVSGAAILPDSEKIPDLIFILGDTKTDIRHKRTWRLTGGEWHGALVMKEDLRSNAWNAVWPVGSMVSAALAANEAFKFAIGRLPLRNEACRVFLESSLSCRWDFGPLSVPAGIVNVGEVDVISAGAICQAALYALSRMPKVQMWGRIFDDDITDISNLNRNMLTLARDVGAHKALLVPRRCGGNLRFKSVLKRFTHDARDIDSLAPRVLVGVDDIGCRWDVQRCNPEWVAVSGTSHFSTSSSAHWAGTPCCGCLHPVEDLAGNDPIPTVSFVSFWAGLAMAVRLVREALGSPYSLGQQHLWLTSLRMDQPHAAVWSPVAFRKDCPVPCAESQGVNTSLPQSPLQ